VTTELERQQYRSVIGHFATGVAVVTAHGPDGPAGMTANALTSLSLEPLLVLVAFDNSARTLPVVREHGRFAVNVLTAEQEPIARVFASKAPEHEKFAGIGYTVIDGVPVIDHALAWIGLETAEQHPGGDHTIVIGEVFAMGAGIGEPLLWYRGGYRELGRT
jgi:flavin reductase (DIM6/NTAB) family NADH-FMN oxidoreductase RutF